MVPESPEPSPTTRQLLVVGQATPSRPPTPAGGVSVFQLAPPALVARMVPPCTGSASPTTRHVVTDGQEIPVSVSRPVVLRWIRQVTPPSEVPAMTYPLLVLPTASQAFSDGQAMP